MDLYFIKVRARSKGTAEEILGYFFGKTNSAPEIDFIVVPLRFANLLDDFTLEENLVDFREKMAKVKAIAKENPSIGDVTLAFMTYLNNMMNRRGKIPLGIEFSTAIKDGDNDVLKVILGDLLEEWSPKMEISVKANAMTLEEYSALTFLDVQEDFADQNVALVYQRPDVVDLPEVFPVIDPINGVSIVQFDIGDKIPVVVLNPGKYEKQIKELATEKPGSAVEGTVLSKELIRVKGGNLFLVKVELAEKLVAKALISPVLKILTDESYMMKRRVGKEKEKELGFTQQPKPIKLEVPHTTGSELLISFMATLLVTGALLIIIYLLDVLKK